MKKIKFFVTPIYPYGNDHYYHEIIVLAEGFVDLGYEICGNVNYWQDYITKEYLIKKSSSDDFDIAIYDYRYVKSFDHLLFRKGYPNFNKSKKHILIDRNDWINPIWKNNNHYKIFNFILGCHTVKGFSFPDNYIPWAMGLSNRIISSIDNTSTQSLESHIGHNFRVWHNLRKMFVDEIKKTNNYLPVSQLLSKIPDEKTNPEEFFYYQNTTRRHNNKYYEIINSSLLFMGFGGYIETLPKIYQPYDLIDKIKRKPYYLLSKINREKSSFVFQWDSFRMWELFYANTCPVFLNFKNFNFILPILPQENFHYLSIDSFSWTDFNNKLKKYNNKEISEIGLNGKNWVINNYSPVKTALRLISFL